MDSIHNNPKTFGPTIWMMLVLLTVWGVAPSTAIADHHKPLKVAWSLYPGYSPFVIAFQKDLISKHGGNVDPILYDVSAKQLPDFEAGRLDGGFFAFADALTLDARSNGGVRLVLVADNSNGADVVVAGPDIGTISDLRGKQIGTGIGSFRELLVRKMLRSENLTVNDVTLVQIGPDEVPDALPDSIQAGQTWEPFTSKAISNGAHIIFSSADTPGLIPDVLVFHKRVVEKRPEDVRAVVDAWFEALEFWRQHPGEGNKIIADATGRDPETISTDGILLLDREENRRAFTDSEAPGSLYVSGRENTQFMISTGVLNSAPDVTRLLDASFLTR